MNQKNNTLKDQVLENKCSTLQDIACNACQARQIELEQTKKEVFILRDRIKVLEALCKRNSSNSSKPPSSDGLKKKNAIPGSQRGKSGKKPGGQKGHRGSTLKPVLKPDSTIQHTLSQCSCGFDLAAIPADKTKACQIFDIPKIEIQVTEHQMESKVCPCCGTRGWSQPPTGVKGVSAAEYGPQIKSFGLDLLMHHFVPSRRVREILGGICGHSISIGSLMNWSKEIFSVLEPFESTLKENLIEAGVVHFDETGMRCQGKLHWLHSASTKDLTYYGIHTRRGMEAMKAFGILPRFKGVAVHDHWSSYFTFSKCLHSLCNSHILRELKFLAEELNEKWASEMQKLLLKIHRKVEKARSKGKSRLTRKTRLTFLREYRNILKLGFSLHSRDPVVPTGKQQKGKNLLDRLQNFQVAILRFMRDFRVPFTNNQSEQDIRMNKVKQKVSGCFRSLVGGEIFCRIRSYVSTMRKRGHTSLAAIQAACVGQPLSI